MERVKKILSSPISRKKNQAPPPPANQAPSSTSTPANQGLPYIGVPIDEIVKRENAEVPHLVVRVCMYITKNGMESEGVFRVNGNSRVVDKLRSSFDTTGDADFEQAGDVMAVAGLLKLFLRELPEGLIPERLTKLFVSIQEEHAKETEMCLLKLRRLLTQLPTTEYQTLKYLAKFLVLIVKKAPINKMNPMALGIVFGPNLFRCSGGIQGLKDQGVTNHITLKFITHYDDLFLEEGEMSPNSPGFVLMVPPKKQKVAPPRPPPPSLDVNMDAPIPSPRKNKCKPNGAVPQNLMVPKLDLETELEEQKCSDEEYIDTNRSNSPFALESDRSEFGTLPSPRIPPANNEVVDKVIHSTVKEMLFGETLDDSLNKTATPVPAPRRKKRSDDKSDDGFEPVEKGELDRQLSVKERISQLQSQESADVKDDDRPKKQRPTSKAFEMFEKKGIIIGMAPADMADRLRAQSDDSDDNVSSQSSGSTSPVPHQVPKNGTKRTSSPPRSLGIMPEPGSDFTDLPQSSHGILPAFKRPAGPSNRRNPSRLPRSGSQTMEENNLSSSKPSEQPPKPRPFLEEPSNDEDVNHNPTKPSISFLNQREDSSPDKSPTASRKPYVPPLDLSILHEHGDGSDPIPAEQGFSVSLHKANQYKDDEAAVLSPRMSKLAGKSKKNAHPDTDVPPSPPTDQTHIASKRGVDDENSALMKQLTKKIQSCKKRIKVFEESFEQEHGYRPSQTDKAARPEIKRSMQELQKARKELRKVKEEMENERRASTSSPSGLAVIPNGRTSYQDHSVNSPDRPPTMDETLQLLLRKLHDKRADDNRPEDLVEQTRDETLDEKLAVQKALLHFENIHGRPTTKAEKSLMRPLYDRYRNIKRILSKAQSPRDKAGELQSVPEDHPIEFTPTSETIPREPMHEPSVDHEEEHEDFMVTKDFRLMKETIRVTDPAQTVAGTSDGTAGARNLHELSVPQLLEEQQEAKSDKKRLRKVLREFEELFFKHNGSKIQKEDRTPMEAEYHEYKQVKARLKLLEALLFKHDPMSAY